jgi:hypothetical protein
MKLKADILAQFPSVREFENEIDFLIEQYSKDKHFVTNLMTCAKPAEELVSQSTGGVKHLSFDDPEYIELVERMNKARGDWLAKQKEIEELAKKELAEKEKSSSITVNEVIV